MVPSSCPGAIPNFRSIHRPTPALALLPLPSIVIELMASELIAVGGTRVVDRPSGTDGERDTSVTSVAVTASAVVGTDPEEL